MATCGEFQYEQIEYSDLFDIRNARLLAAQIDSIDRNANTASLTIIEECLDIAEKELTAIPFFYHCEDSTGTIEDLAKGHKAFVEEDFVYVLFVPERNEVEERFYIIGHVDIRSTRQCNIYEYVILRTGYPISGGIPRACATIFDVGLGVTLDLDTFVNIDESSPDKPESFPCVMNEAFDAWLAYNFDITPKPESPLFSVKPKQDYVAFDVETNEIISQDPTCTDPRYTHYRRSFTFNQPGVHYVSDSYVTETGAYLPYPGESNCLYTGITTRYVSLLGSGADVMGWVFTDASGQELTIALELIDSGDMTQTGYTPTLVEFSVQFDANLNYPFPLDGYPDGVVSEFSHVYTSPSQSRPNWMTATINGVYNGVPQSTWAVSSTSNFEGEHGMYYTSRFSLNTSMEAYVPRAIGVVALKQDVGTINEENPLTLERYMQNIDIVRSRALAQALLDLDEYLYNYLASVGSGGGGAAFLFEFPCHKKEIE